jgi:regulatory protein
VFGNRRKKEDSGERRVITDPERSRERTMNRAIRLLAAKPRSVRELRDRLLEKRWTDESIVDAVLAKLSDYKYLDDDQYARDVALSKLRQSPQGKRRLQMTMSQKKLEKETVETAIASAYEEMPEDELIDIAIQKRLRTRGRPETREDAKKFYDHLLRRGFSYDLIRTKMSCLASGAYDPSEDDQL